MSNKVVNGDVFSTRDEIVSVFSLVSMKLSGQKKKHKSSTGRSSDTIRTARPEGKWNQGQILALTSAILFLIKMAHRFNFKIIRRLFLSQVLSSLDYMHVMSPR